MWCPTVHTKLVILLGDPLEHSFSPRMHNRVFNLLNMDYCYWPVEVSAEDLPAVFAGLVRMNVAGCNVTIPHKVRIMELLDEIDPLAGDIGAVNTVVIKDGHTRGFNTDGEGFLKALETDLRFPVTGRNVFLLGSGGAARSVAMTLAVRGAGRIFICNRTNEKAEELAGAINERIRPCAEAVRHNNAYMARILPACHVLVNTTSVGMFPRVDDLPVDPSLLFRDLVVADIVYNPRKTALLRAAETAGCRFMNGLGMLVYQGAEAFRLWTGITPPVEAMYDEIR